MSELDYIDKNVIDYSPDKVSVQTTAEILQFEDIPILKAGSTTYIGGGGLAVAAGDIYEIQYNAGNKILGADSGFVYQILGNEERDITLSTPNGSYVVLGLQEVSEEAWLTVHSEIFQISNEENGGDIKIYTSDTSGATSGGGNITIESGDGFNSGVGGHATFTAGKGGETGDGGYVVISAGDSGDTSGVGGDLIITSGAGNNGGGNIILNIGSKGDSGAKGVLKILDDSGNNSIYGILDFGSITSSDKTFTFPDASGTVALTSDITIEDAESNSSITPVADGTYTVGKGDVTDGTITVVSGIITAITEASDV